MFVRRERSDDADAVDGVICAAFDTGAGRPVESSLVFALRAGPDHLPALCLVAQDGDQIVGQVTCSRGRVGDVAAVGLGPIAVLPDRQEQGIGQALMHAVLGAADALDEPLVALLGDPGFYARFGFAPAEEVGISAPDPSWSVHFQVRTLSQWEPGLAGPFRYAAAFDDL